MWGSAWVAILKRGGRVELTAKMKWAKHIHYAGPSVWSKGHNLQGPLSGIAWGTFEN